MASVKRDPGTMGPSALAAAISAAVAGSGNTALAQDDGALDEIIVTATRRAERLQDVPESITAFDSEAIARRGLQQMDDYARYVPGLSLGMREPGGTSIIFRGVATSGIQFGSTSSAGLYLDEQPITSSGRNPDPRLIDVERLEALRGPQGTLYGASSQSGTLRVITNKPDPGSFAAWVDGQVTQIDDGDAGYDASAMVNIPLVGNKLALRLVGFAAEDAGFIDNVLTDSSLGTYDNADRVEENVNSIETTGGRAALRWDITENLDATVAAIFQNKSADGHTDVNPGLGDLQQVRFENENLDDDWYQLALTVNASLPFGDLVVAGSYFDRDFRYEADATDYEFNFNCPKYDLEYNPNPPPPFCQPNFIAYDFGSDPRGFATNDERTETTTLEVRLASKAGSESRWAWLVGAFYSDEEEKTEFNSFVRGYENTQSFQYQSDLSYIYTGVFPDETERWYIGRYDTDLEEKAIFGELSYDLTENFTITVGGRWFDYDRSFKQIQEQPEDYITLDGSQDNSESGSVGKLNLTYRFDADRLVYATYSEGFRVGGSNPLKAQATLPEDYDSDELHNYEVGAKTEWFDNRLRFNIAAYYMEWDDIQIQVEDPSDFFQLGFVNFPQAEISGVEGDFAISVSEQFQIDGSFSWNDAEISEASTLTTTDGVDVFTFTVEDGARLPLTPDWQASLGLEYRPGGTLLGGAPFARFDYAYVGDSVNSLSGIESVVSGAPVEEQSSYHTGDLRLGLDAESWTASVFVDNVWDERAELFLSNRWGNRKPEGGIHGFQRLSINTPRTFGVQFRFNF